MKTWTLLFVNERVRERARGGVRASVMFVGRPGLKGICDCRGLLLVCAQPCNHAGRVVGTS